MTERQKEIDEMCSIEWHNEQVMHLIGEKDELKNECEYWKSRCKEIGDIARKETAKEIIEMLVPDCEICDEMRHKGCMCLRAKLAGKIAKQYGTVEVEQ